MRMPAIPYQDIHPKIQRVFLSRARDSNTNDVRLPVKKESKEWLLQSLQGRGTSRNAPTQKRANPEQSAYIYAALI